jgi:serine/threonine-protein kinase HipA
MPTKKNSGLLHAHPQAERPRLAPLYDLVATAAYDDINQRTGALHADRTLALNLARIKH